MSVKPIPEGYHSVTPYLIVRGGAAAIEYYKQAFGAVELFRIPGPGETIGHAEIRIGDSMIMLADEHPSMGYNGPQTIGGTPVSLMIYIEDVDTVFNRAIELGGTVKQAIEDKFYGDRSGTLTDPFGHIWHISTHTEDVAPEEMERRAKEHSAAAAGGGQ
jgi:PhnB protein